MSLDLRKLFRRHQPLVVEPPRNLQAMLQEALAHHEAGRLAQAGTLYEEILAADPHNADAWHLRGVVASQEGASDRAVEMIDKAIAIEPRNASFFFNRGLALKQLQRYEAAAASFEQAIALSPGHADMHASRGHAMAALNRLEAAADSFSRAAALRPEFAEHHYNLARVLQQLKRFDDAVASYTRAIALRPDFADAFYNRAAAQRELGRAEAALADFDRALTMNPRHAEGHAYRADVLTTLKRTDAALESIDRALALDPGLAQAWCIRGVARLHLKQFRGAIEDFDRAIALKADLVEAHVNRGNALHALERAQEAIASYDRALELRPDDAEALFNRGVALSTTNELESAVANFRAAIALKPDHEFAVGNLLHARLDLCDWGGIGADLVDLELRIARGENAAVPFTVIASVESPALQRTAAENFVTAKCPANPALGPIPQRAKEARIRIGYFSADFRMHAVSYLTAALFEAHDRERFEISGFSFGPESDDEIGRRVSVAFDHFHDVRESSDSEIATLARQCGIDIAVDLGGHTEHARTGIFALRAAPVQVSYVGYLGTMGAEYFDYLVADDILIPEASRGYYSEKIAYLPSYQANEARRDAASEPFTREELGLPAEGFVFCCFNNPYKLTPATFASWMKILGQVERSSLLLYATHETARANLRREAVTHGVSADRLVFCGQLPRPQYLSRFHAADVFLDTLPYNAGTVASDALWSGLPVLTLMGQSFASRVGASLLTALRLPELITRSRGEYEERAVRLATDPAAYAGVKAQLEKNRLTAPLFDIALFTRNIEALYSRMHERYHAGLPPDHIRGGAWTSS